MTAQDYYDRLKRDISDSVDIILANRTFADIHHARISGQPFNSDTIDAERWIALCELSLSTNLAYLSYAINSANEIVPWTIKDRGHLAVYQNSFVRNEARIVAEFNKIVGKPSQIFVGDTQPITMENYLNKLADEIYIEAEQLRNCKNILDNN